jgi:hypothetical protein
MSWFVVLKGTNVPKRWANPTPKQEKKVLAKEWNILGKEIGQEILDYFKGDIPLDTWLDVNILDTWLRRTNESLKNIVELPVNALKPVFYHWSLDYFGRRTNEKQNIIHFLVSISNLMDKTDNEKIGDEIFDLTRKYRKHPKVNRLNEANEKRLAILEEEKKESEWQKTLSIASQWGVKPNWQVEQNKDTDGLKEQLPPAARKKLEEKLQ